MQKSLPYTTRNIFHASLILGLSTLCCFSLFSCGVFDSNKPFSGGNGTIENPFQISSLEQLQKITEDENLDKHFIQVADIYASASAELQNGSGFKFIGDAEHPFTGSYDGNGFSITNLKINFNKFDQYNGMFGYVKDGLLQNITIDNRAQLAKLDKGSGALSKPKTQLPDKMPRLQKNDVANMDGVGGLAGMNNGGMIINCHFIGSITFFTTGAGLVGINTGTIENSSFEGNLSGPVSGLVTYNSGSINRSSVKNGVLDGQVASGFVRYNFGEIQNSYADIGFLGGSNGAAGFVLNNDGIIRTSYVKGILGGGNRFSSGFVGDNRGLIEDAFVFVEHQITLLDNPDIISELGGFAGRNESDGVIRNAFTAGSISIDGNMEELSLFGAFAGENLGSIDHGYWDKESTGIETGVDEGDPNGATGLTTAQMTGPAAEQNMPEFDWVNIWRTTEAGYPLLRWEER